MLNLVEFKSTTLEVLVQDSKFKIYDDKKIVFAHEQFS